MDNLYLQYTDKISHKITSLAHGAGALAVSAYSKNKFYEKLDFLKEVDTVLDLGCGAGEDVTFYKTVCKQVFGLDGSQSMISLAKQKNPEVKFTLGTFEKIPFEEEQFDVVLSKYAMQTSPDIELVYKQVKRILKPNGIFLFLVTHPMRQYFERKNCAADYFKQDIVDSVVYEGELVLKEPTHTMNDYLSDFFLSNFSLELFEESFEPCSEYVDGRTYPGFVIIKAGKKTN